VPFRDDLHAARTRAEQLEAANAALAGELRDAYRGRFPKRSIRYSVGVTAMSLLGLLTVGAAVAAGVLSLPRPASATAPELAPAIAMNQVDVTPPDVVGVRAASDELIVEDSKLGAGRAAQSGDNLRVHYVGTLVGGKQFDSSRDRGQPFAFTLGTGQVIKGWDRGLAGMRVGGRRKLTIGPSLAYGEHGQGTTIGPSATLVFDVELLAID